MPVHCFSLRMPQIHHLTPLVSHHLLAVKVSVSDKSLTLCLYCTSAFLFTQDLLVVVVCWTLKELLTGVLRASPDASQTNSDIYIYL